MITLNVNGTPRDVDIPGDMLFPRRRNVAAFVATLNSDSRNSAHAAILTTRNP
jgi:hypothetical protein